jgi:hypothetical protein
MVIVREVLGDIVLPLGPSTIIFPVIAVAPSFSRSVLWMCVVAPALAQRSRKVSMVLMVASLLIY